LLGLGGKRGKRKGRNMSQRGGKRGTIRKGPEEKKLKKDD